MNLYSSRWFEVFSQRIDAVQTEREAEFVARHVPRERYPRILDLCCGEGRHAAALCGRGYRVTGLDKNPAAVRAARGSCPSDTEFIEADAREIARLGCHCDAVVCMWQSFGYFTAADNFRLLADLRHAVADHGRLILDVYNADFFRDRQGDRSFDRGAERVVERKFIHDRNRLRVEINHGTSGEQDVFDWQLFSPDELSQVLRQAGWEPVLKCSGFDDGTVPSPSGPRMQFVAVRREDRVR